MDSRTPPDIVAEIPSELSRDFYKKIDYSKYIFIVSSCDSSRDFYKNFSKKIFLELSPVIPA